MGPPIPSFSRKKPVPFNSALADPAEEYFCAAAGAEAPFQDQGLVTTAEGSREANAEGV